MQWHNVQMLIAILPLYEAYDSHTCKSQQKLLPNAKQAAVEKQMSSSTLEQFKHLFIASVIGMRRGWARCTGTGFHLNVRALS